MERSDIPCLPGVGCVASAAAAANGWRTNLLGWALATLLLAAVPSLRAQETVTPPQPPLRIEIQPHQHQPQPEEIQEMPEDPYWQETVDRAVEEFKSDNPEVRRSAVMLLGKYPVEPARQVIHQALEDSHAGVRQAALVSLLEEQGQINPAFASKVLNLLADPHVGIRRIASNSVRSLIHSFPFGMQPGTVQMQRQLSPEATRILQGAFRDEDVSVRRNMVNNYPFLQITLPEETVVALLKDPDQEVAVHALRWGLGRLTPATLTREIGTLAQHESDIFRLELARALQSHRSPAVLEALDALQEDPYPPVAIEAMLGIFNHRQSVSQYERIMNLYRESRQRSDAGQRIIFAAQMLGDQGEPFLREWMQDNDPSLRQHAVRIYLSRFGREADRDLLFSLLLDSIPGIRQQAARTLMQMNHQFSDDDVRRLTSNRHPDVRQAAAGIASLLPSDRADDLLLDLLLDEVREVRMAALQQIGVLQISGWQEIMSISLRVDDPIMQRNALEWLMRHTNPEILGLLRAYLDENPQSFLRPQIETHLRRHQRPDPS